MTQKFLGLGAVATAGLFALGTFPVFADDSNITTEAELTSCIESTTSTSCVLGADITVTSDSVTSPSNVTKTLDLNGYSITEGNATYIIFSSGELTVKDSGTSTKTTDISFKAGSNGILNIMSGSFSRVDIYYPSSNATLNIYGGTISSRVTNTVNTTGTINIYDGTIAGIRSSAELNISGGTFTASISNDGPTVIDGGTFNDSVLTDGDLAINGGTFSGTVGPSLLSSNTNTFISNGTFQGTVNCGEENSILEIVGGTFTDLDCGSYETGQVLKISGGTFSKSFGIGVETLEISGGTFSNDSGLDLDLNNSSTQSFSITGGSFINTADEYGRLFTIVTDAQPTEASIRAIFAGGNVLDGKLIDLDTSATGRGVGQFLTYIMKEQASTSTTGSLKIPDTGASTKNEAGLGAASLPLIIISILAGSLGLGAFIRFVLRKKVSF